ncbi:MAG: non-canonical purine NTP pyrophosphatase [Clostridia bacterium]|nr:non-canonical purine NTP pyrophosphatase [Clostridia bacterium]
MEITYVTGNKAKIESAKQFLEPYGIKVNHIKMETPEIQADFVDEIAKYSAKYACKILNKDVIKNDTGFYVDALGGFPGAYSHYVEDKIGFEGLLKLLDGVENRKASFVEAFAYCKVGKEPIIFKSITSGIISKEPQGSYGWGWDFVFIPDGEEKTLASFPDNERYLKWNTDGFYQIIEYLKEKNK